MARFNIYPVGGLKRINIPLNDFSFETMTDENGEASIDFGNLLMNKVKVNIFIKLFVNLACKCIRSSFLIIAQ